MQGVTPDVYQKRTAVKVGSSDHVQTREVSPCADVKLGPRAHRQGYLNVLFYLLRPPLLYLMWRAGLFHTATKPQLFK